MKPDYDSSNRVTVYQYVEGFHRGNEVVTGLLYVDKDGHDLHALNKTVNDLLVSLPTALNGEAILELVQARYK